MSPDIYDFDDWMIALVDQVLDDAADLPMPILKTIFGVPLSYNRVENTRELNGQIAVVGWDYTLSRGDNLWALEMSIAPSQAEQKFKWKAVGDLEAAHRDLSLLKLATS